MSWKVRREVDGGPLRGEVLVVAGRLALSDAAVRRIPGLDGGGQARVQWSNK